MIVADRGQQHRRAVAVQVAHDVALADDARHGRPSSRHDQGADAVLVEQVEEPLDGLVGPTVTTSPPLLRTTSEILIGTSETPYRGPDRIAAASGPERPPTGRSQHRRLGSSPHADPAAPGAGRLSSTTGAMSRAPPPRPARLRHRREPAARRPRQWAGRGAALDALPGGLVTAMESVMQEPRRRLGRLGRRGRRGPRAVRRGRHDLRPVALSADEVADYYEGFSNDTLWPIYHDVIVPATFHRDWCGRLRRVNQRFAEAVCEAAAEGATVWVHDYQLQLVPAMVRELRPDVRIGWFDHIPFPPFELFAQLPWRGRSSRACSAPTTRLPAGSGRRELRAGLPAAARACRHGRTRDAASDDASEDAAGRPGQRRATRSRSTPRAWRRSPAARDDRRGRRRSASSSATRAPCCSASTGSTTPRASGTGSRPTGSCSRTGASPRPTTCWCRWRRPSRERVDAYRRLRAGDRGRGRPHQRRARPHRPPAGRSTCTTPTRAHEMAALFLAADVMLVDPAARRHEPRRQGVRHLPPRRGRRAGALASSPAPYHELHQAFV